MVPKFAQAIASGEVPDPMGMDLIYGREAVASLFRSGGEASDALLCGSDQIARGALDCLREQLIDVPRQVSVVGFDNWDEMTEAARPTLTSIDMNLNQLGLAAGDVLLKLMSGHTLSGVHRLSCGLVVRHSSTHT